MNGRDADTRVLVALARVEKLSPRRRELLLEQATLPSGLLSAEMKPALSAALGDALTDFYRFVDEADPTSCARRTGVLPCSSPRAMRGCSTPLRSR